MNAVSREASTSDPSGLKIGASAYSVEIPTAVIIFELRVPMRHFYQ
jgi:hypothetical protein